MLRTRASELGISCSEYWRREIPNTLLSERWEVGFSGSAAVSHLKAKRSRIAIPYQRPLIKSENTTWRSLDAALLSRLSFERM